MEFKVNPFQMPIWNEPTEETEETEQFSSPFALLAPVQRFPRASFQMPKLFLTGVLADSCHRPRAAVDHSIAGKKEKLS